MRLKHAFSIWFGLCLSLLALPVFAQGDTPGYANFCPDFPVAARASRLVGGMPAQVAVPSLNVRADALINAQVVAQLTAGTLVWTTSAPACNDGYVWWQVAFQRNGVTEFGWAAEATASSYLLEPLTPEMEGMQQDPTAFSAQNLGVLTEVGSIDDLGGVRSIAWSPDDQRFAVTTVGATWVYDVANLNAEPLRLKSNGVQTHDVNRVEFNPAGDMIALYGPTLELWRLNGGTAEQVDSARVVNISPGVLAASDLSPDWSRYASGESDEITIWESATAKPLNRLTGHILLGTVLFSPDGATLVSGGSGGMMVNDTTLRIWDVETGEQRAVIDGFVPLPRIVFTPDSQTVLAQVTIEQSDSFTGILYAIDAQTGELGMSFPLPPGGQLADFSLSGDGRLLAVASINYEDPAGTSTIITFFDMASGQPVNSTSFAGDVVQIAFDSTGSTLAVVKGQVFPSPINPILFLGVNG